MATMQISNRQIRDGAINNAKVSASAAIAYSKLNLAGSIVNADVATGAAIEYAKLTLTGSIVNADISATAAIAYSKLALTASIVNADVAAGAAIAYSKLALTDSIVVADVAAAAKATAATANTFVLRDASGRAQFATPSASADAATKGYVDSVASGLDLKASVRVATTTWLAALSGTPTVDGVTLVAGDRILVKNQEAAAGFDPATNGIYVVAAGAWSRASDADGTNGNVTAGMFTFVEEGTTLKDTGWVLTTNNPITVGTTALDFTQFSSAGVVTAGSELTKSGNTISHKLQGALDATTTTYDMAKVTVNTFGHVTAATARSFQLFGGTATAGQTTIATTANPVANSATLSINGLVQSLTAGHFSINSGTGQITVADAMEVGDVYEVQLVA